MTETFEVTLSPAEAAGAARVGALRDHSHAAAGPVVLDRTRAHVAGALAELAFAKAFGLPWSGRYFDGAAWRRWRGTGHDVGDYEVRSTGHPGGRLLGHPADADDSPFVLVRTHRTPTFVFAGWAYGHEVKEPGNWRDVGHGRPCFYLPNARLRPMAALRRWAEGVTA